MYHHLLLKYVLSQLLPFQNLPGKEGKNKKDTRLALESYLLHIHRVTEWRLKWFGNLLFHLAALNILTLFCRLLLDILDGYSILTLKCPSQTMPTGLSYLFQKSVSSLYLNSLNFFSCPKLMCLCWKNETIEDKV